MTTDGRLNTKIYEKRDDLNFPIVNFPFLCCNIPAAPAYGVYVSQLIRYSRASLKYADFVERGILLSQKLLRHGHESIKLRSSLKKFYGRHHELIGLAFMTKVCQKSYLIFFLSHNNLPSLPN